MSSPNQVSRGSLAATGQSDTVFGKAVLVQVSGTYVATVKLQGRSDQSSTWIDDHDFSAGGDSRVGESNVRMEWRLNVSAYTSGTIVYSLESSALPGTTEA